MAQLRLGVVGIGDGGLNLGQEQFAITLAQPMHGHGHGTGVHAQTRRRFSVVAMLRFPGRKFLQPLKQLGLAALRVVRLQAGEGVLQNAARPAAVEALVRRKPGGGLGFQPKLGRPANTCLKRADETSAC